MINANTYKGGHNDYLNYGGEVRISDFDTNNSRNKSHYYARRIADDFDFEAEQASERMITLIQPLMIIFLAVVICLIIISVLLPIYTLYNNVGNM